MKILWSLLMVVSASLGVASEPTPPPNIVLVLADDLGWCDIGAGAPGVRTPHLDRLAAESASVSRFRVAPVCAPSRAMLLTGRHHLRTGVWGVHGGQDYLDRGEELLPEILRRRGYATGMWGKWHNGNAVGYLPQDRGFEETLVLDLYRHRDPSGRWNGERQVFPGRWADDVLVDHALDFIRRSAVRRQPFFAYIPSMTPHSPLDAPQDRVERFRQLGCRDRVAVLRAQVEMLDEAMGRLLAGLEEAGVADQTIVLFLSDNGPACLEGDYDDEDRRQRDPGRLRGWKGDVWENGVRSPLFVRWPGRIPHGERDGDAWMYDLLPTICRWAGAEPAGKPLDGIDIGAWLAGGPPVQRTGCTWVLPATPPVPSRTKAERVALDEYRPLREEDLAADRQVAACYDGDWKLARRPNVGFGDDRTWLVNLADDPGERTNRAEEQAELAARLGQDLDGWWSTIRQESSAFRFPTFPVDALAGGRIAACAPAHLEGSLVNQGIWLTGWAAVGDQASWSLLVARGGAVQVELAWKGPAPEGTVLEVSVSGVSVQGLVTGGTVQWEGPVELDPGPATLQVRTVAPGPGGALLACSLVPYGP